MFFKYCNKINIYYFKKKRDYFCDYFLDDINNNQVDYRGYCNLKYNHSCPTNCEHCGSDDGSLANKYMINASTPIKPISNLPFVINRPTQKYLIFYDFKEYFLLKVKRNNNYEEFYSYLKI